MNRHIKFGSATPAPIPLLPLNQSAYPADDSVYRQSQVFWISKHTFPLSSISNSAWQFGQIFSLGMESALGLDKTGISNRRHCAEAYFCTPHKRCRRLTPKTREGTIYGRKIATINLSRSPKSVISAFLNDKNFVCAQFWLTFIPFPIN